MPTLFYIHDPMCSWCWAYQPVLAQIRQALNTQLSIVDILGGLAADTDEPMPAALREQIQGHWQRIQQQVGSQFNFDFWSDPDIVPRRSTYPACRAVIAAGFQSADEGMVAAIQEAYYLRAMNPSDEETLLQLADELGLNFDQFMADLASDEVEQALQQQLQFTRQLPIQGFPSWVLEVDGEYHAIAVDYDSAQTSLVRIAEKLKAHR